MKKDFFKLIIAIILLVSTFFAGCAEEPGEGLYNPNNFVSGPAPKITNIETIYPVYSDSQAFAGIGVIRITGENFLNDASLNTVYFDNLPGTVLSASETELQVKTPNVLGDSVRIKTVTNVDSFSTDYYYKLVAAVEEVFSFKESEAPKKITCDANGDLFFTMYLNGALSDSVWLLTPAGILSGYGNPVREYDAIKMDPNGELLGIHGTRSRIYTFPAGGGTQSLWLNVGEKMKSFDFDANLNIWTAGPATADICRIRTTDKDIKKFTYLKEVQALRVYNGDLYLATKTDSTIQIVTFPIINDDSLGTVETEYLDLTSLADYDVVGMTFDVDGNMYIAVTSPEGIIKSPMGGGTYEALYPDVIYPERTSISLFWGPQNESNLYLSRTAVLDTSGAALVNPGIIKINTLNFGAPNYGRGDL